MFTCFKSDAKILDKSYGQWTTKWWEWALSTTRASNPVLDKTGEYYDINQPSFGVWFLAGIFGDEEKSHPTRQINLPEGLALLIPILNCEANSIEYPHLKTDSDLIEHVSKDIESVVKKDCFINNINIIPERVQSEPRIFEFTLPEENVLGVKGGQLIRVCADGYWIFLHPLPKGNYIIDFEGSCEFGRLSSGARYELKVI